MRARLLKHFNANDPIIGTIVSLTDEYELGVATRGSAFEVLARSIAGQQLSGAVARKIIERLIALHDGEFPTPTQIVAATPEALRAVGFSFAKIAALKDLAAHSLDGRLPSDAELAALDDEAIIERCVAVRGIGRWTVQMLLMFHFGREDVMPVDDFGVRNGFRLAYGLKGLPKPKALLKYAERWKPYRSAGAWYLWRAVDLHQEGKLPKRAGRAVRIEVVLPKVVKGALKAKAPEKGKAAKTKALKKSKSKSIVKAKVGAARPEAKLQRSRIRAKPPRKTPRRAQ